MYVAEVLVSLLTATFAELPVSVMHKTNWREVEGPSSKAHKQFHENKRAFMLCMKI
ncbi:4075_t:CDS:2, partial [Racocetra persica]